MLNLDEQQALLDWYDRCQRTLPWRLTNDPWAILLSEVLLQQTQVSRGLVFWERMMKAFPTVERMAVADVDDVLKAWEGAGYYSRARRLHALSRRVVAPVNQGGYDGVLPTSASELLTLPGIGPYTAAAVASIAHGEAVACVDGNIRRVMARQTASLSPMPAEVQAWADGALHDKRPGDWNQALMELGATVCTPKRVKCSSCPLAAGCDGATEPERYPEPKRQKVKDVTLHARVDFAANGEALLQQRPLSGMFAGLWGPFYDEELTKVMPTEATPIATLNHALSHRRLTVHVHAVVHGDMLVGTRRHDVAVSTLDEKVLACAAQWFDQTMANSEP